MGSSDLADSNPYYHVPILAIEWVNLSQYFKIKGQLYNKRVSASI